MSKVEELEKAIDALPEEEYIQLRQWFSEKDSKSEKISGTEDNGSWNKRFKHHP